MTTRAADILMVDDRRENLLALEAILAPLNLNLVSATSGEEALKRLLENDFALILLDVNMPDGLSGLETAEYIKQRDRSRHTPIIFLTAMSEDPEQMFRGYEAGAVDYLQKPFVPTVLRSKVSVFVDLHHLRREAEENAHRALHDSLTGLPNRTLFLDRLEVALAGLDRRASRIAVFFLDLDGFKQVNDKLGHDAGDRLLADVATRLRSVLRPGDTLARFGGDEFTILCTELKDDCCAQAIAERVLRVVADSPVSLVEGDVPVTASVGVSLTADAEESPTALIRHADAAMYRAKDLGKACYQLRDESRGNETAAAAVGAVAGS